MRCAGMLLTGGASRRMGRDKALIAVPGSGAPSPVTLAGRTAALLRAVADPVVEVGPGRSGLPAVSEEPPGAGPLAALAAGAAALAAAGWTGPVLVMATDLPLLDAGFLTWLAGHPDPRSVVPVAAGRVQPLCARYRADDLATAGRLVAAGRRAVSDLLGAIDFRRAGEDEWGPCAGHRSVLADADTPADLERLLTDTATGGTPR